MTIWFKLALMLLGSKLFRRLLNATARYAWRWAAPRLARAVA